MTLEETHETIQQGGGPSPVPPEAGNRTVSGVAVLVDFQLKPGTRDAFRRLIDDNARESVATEPGCLRFDVLEPDDKPDGVLLYEVYANGAAFQTHLASRHYSVFAAASDDLCISKAVVTCTLVCEGGA